ncbi:hypothetical protein FQA47_015656 [Oryzias melastigma]|uniref:Uncharacterized protein n=1 Tax=Oryzias melastigma TaxID=30732 RepID=A0A834CGF9_ORYME|nr:hypothetical protein FQA47_015656 [Oryzias melastigma]
MGAREFAEVPLRARDSAPRHPRIVLTTLRRRRFDWPNSPVTPPHQHLYAGPSSRLPRLAPEWLYARARARRGDANLSGLSLRARGLP